MLNLSYCSLCVADKISKEIDQVQVHKQNDEDTESTKTGLSLTSPTPGSRVLLKVLSISDTRGLIYCHLQQSAFPFGIPISFTNHSGSPRVEMQSVKVN